MSRSLAAALLLILAPFAAAQSPGTQPDAGSLEQRYRAGIAAFQSGRAYQALELLGQVEKQSPRFREVQKYLGQACLVAGLLPAAKEHFEQALAQDPTDAHAAFLLGLALHDAARFVEALPALERARQLAPENPNPLIYRALCHLRLGQVESARSDIGAALARAPENVTARTVLAEIELSTGDAASAEPRVRAVLAEEPGSVEARLLLGRLLFETGRPEQAVPELRQALAASPDRTDILYRLAQALLRSGRSDEGRRLLEQFQSRSRREERIRVLELAVRSDPDDIESRIELTGLLLDHGEPGSALLHLAVLERQRADDPRIEGLRRRLAAMRSRHR